MENYETLIKKANKIYLDNFEPTTCFERAIFFSWYCEIRDCKFCYMSTQRKDAKFKKIGRRSVESLLAEVILCKKLGWELGFLSGGIGAYTKKGFFELVKLINLVYEDKFWVNVGPLSKKEILELKPYIKGVVGSIETVNWKLREKVCPSKNLDPYLRMFKQSSEIGLKNAMTVILGLGENIDDFENFKKFVKKYDIAKVHFYGLNPQKGTIFENSLPPSEKYQATWIAKSRIEFPKLDIQMGIWLDRTDRISTLLNAGANSISKFPATRYFNSKSAQEIETQAKLAGRKFKGTLTKLPDVDWDYEVDKLNIDNSLKEKIKLKLNLYLKKII